MKQMYLERVNLFEPNIYIGIHLELEKSAPIKELKLAIEKALILNESTTSKIVLTESGDAYYEKLPFALNQGELLRIFIIHSDKNPDNTTSIIFMAHHLLGDGKSLIYLIEDIMNFASTGRNDINTQRNYKPIILISPEDCPKNSRPANFYFSFINKYNRKWAKNKQIFTWTDYEELHKTYWDNHSSQLLFHKFNSETTFAIVSLAKKLNISVNSLIITAFVQGSTKGKSIGIPVNIRENNNRSLSNQTSGINVNFKYNHRRSFSYNAQKLHTKIYHEIDNPKIKYFVMHFMPALSPTLIDSVLLNRYGLFNSKVSNSLAIELGYQCQKVKDLGFSNLGKLDIPYEYGNYSIKNISFIPPVISYAKYIFGIITTKDGMNISYHFMSSTNYLLKLNFSIKVLLIY